MRDVEHLEWLEDERARKNGAKNNRTTPPIPPKKADERKRGEPEDDQIERAFWRGEA